MEKIFKDRFKFMNFMKNTRPINTLYKTYSGKSAFSDSYEMIVEYKLKDRSFASVVGTSFDYLARFIIAKRINKNKDAVLFGLRCEEGISCFPKDMQDKLLVTYKGNISIIKEFIYGNTKIDLTKILEACCFFGRLEHAARLRWIPNENTLKHIKKENFEILSELMKMASLFFKTFVKSGMVKPDSDVIFNPSFGNVGKTLKITDADVYIDGVLWDFKTTKSSFSKPDDETQLWEYYILSEVCKRDNDQECSLIQRNVRAIAFYKARFGEIEYLLIRNAKKDLIKKTISITLETYRNIDGERTIDEAFAKTKSAF